MNQNLSQIRDLQKNQNCRKIKNHKHHFDNSFISIECPYCGLVGANLFWSQSETLGHCSNCSKNWLEYQGMTCTF